MTLAELVDVAPAKTRLTICDGENNIYIYHTLPKNMRIPADIRDCIVASIAPSGRATMRIYIDKGND